MSYVAPLNLENVYTMKTPSNVYFATCDSIAMGTRWIYFFLNTVALFSLNVGCVCFLMYSLSGKVLWSVDPEIANWSRHFVSSWTVYHSASLPDLDGDGILELVVSLGEDESVEVSFRHT